MALADGPRRPTLRAVIDVHIRPLGRTLQVAPGSNLLQALQAAAVPVSYSCMAGRCGTCRCRVLEGQLLEDGREGASAAGARADEQVLACRCTVTGPCTIEIPEPDEVVVHPARIVKATVVALEAPTHDIRRLLLAPAKPFEFSPGQYAQLQFAPGLARPYSMAGLAGDARLEFHVRVVPGGQVSGHVAHTLRVGDAVRVSGPLGAAYLRRRHDGPMLCVAGGTGLAPVLSVVRGALAAGLRNPIHLYFGVRSPRDVYGLPWLQQLQREHPALTLHVVVAGGGDPARERCGLVTDAIAQDLGDLTGWRAYLCGAPPMVEAATLLVRAKGIAASHVHADAFYAQEPTGDRR